MDIDPAQRIVRYAFEENTSLNAFKFVTLLRLHHGWRFIECSWVNRNGTSYYCTLFSIPRHHASGPRKKDIVWFELHSYFPYNPDDPFLPFRSQPLPPPDA